MEIGSNEDEYYFEIIHETYPGESNQGAIIVTDGINKESLPKSQVRFEMINSRDAKVIVPNWLAKDRGLI